MNKTNSALIAIILVLACAFVWYAATHPSRGPQPPAAAPSASSANPPQAQAVRSGPRTLILEQDAAALDALALEVGVGEMHVTPSPDNKLHVQVTLQQKEREFMWFFHWMSQGTQRDIASAAIRARQDGGRVALSLDYPGVNQDDIKQDWDVQVPARLKLAAVMKVGEMSVEGVAGGVDAKLNVGELSIDAPEGAIRGDVNVGEIRATSGSAHYGRVELSSNIGEALLTIGGKNAGRRDHGGLGNRVSLDGSGPDEMHLSVNVGEATLHLVDAGPGETK